MEASPEHEGAASSPPAAKSSLPSRPTHLSSLSQIWRSFETPRNIVAFFFLGLANNFGYVIMLSAAHDLLHIIDELADTRSLPTEFVRPCNGMSTGGILLANIIPCTVVKIFAPFIPLWIHARMIVIVITAALGLLLVALAINEIVIIFGICLVSFSQGLGETSILAYTVFFKSKTVLSTWASGTGFAGLLGSFSYSLMIQMGFTPQYTIYTMLVMPAMMAINFWVIVERPLFHQFQLAKADFKQIRQQARSERRHSTSPRELPKSSLYENARTIPKILTTYTVWYGLVYFFEYFINQGLYELIYIPGSFLDQSAQYRWYNTIYQLGVFLSRSSMDLVHINKTYLTAVFQGVNVIVFLMEAVLGYITHIPIILIIVLWEGLLGGACYVNTFRLIATEWPMEGRDFAMSINTIGDSVMVILAGVAAIPVHNKLCRTKPTYGLPPMTPNATLTVGLAANF